MLMFASIAWDFACLLSAVLAWPKGLHRLCLHQSAPNTLQLAMAVALTA